MKKITLMFTLFAMSLGYSQSLPFDFSDPVQLMTGFEGTTASIIDDAGNDVLEVVGGMADWDHVAITFAENVDLSDDANNTMTFRIKPTTDLGTRDHILKFEGGVGGAGTTELPFTSTGTAWQDITLDMPAGAGNYSSMVIFTDAGGGTATGTYLIDDIACTCGNIAPPSDPEAILPIDFSDAFELFTAGGSTPSLTTDPGDSMIPADPSNAVMQVDGGGGDWDNVTINFAQNVDLSDPANNTITFRMKATTDLGVRNHLLKFEGGSGGSVTAEVPFSTVAGTDWQDFALDFDASTPGGPGNYDKVFLFTDAGSGAIGTYLIDDIAGGTNIVPVSDPEPAPIPTAPDGETYSIYNDTNGYTTTFPFAYDFGTLGGEPDLDTGAGVNLALKFDFSFAGYGQGEGGPDDVSAYNFVNFMYWAEPGVPGFQFRMISNNGGVTEHTYEIGTQEAIVTGQWTQVSIPMTYFTGLGFSSTNFFQWKCETFMQVVTDPGTVYMDNIILTLNPLSIDEFDIAQFNIFPNPTNNIWTIKTGNENITKVELFDVLGKRVLNTNPNSNEAVINGSTLPNGLYFARIYSESSINSIKLIKK